VGAAGNALSKEVELDMEHLVRKQNRLLVTGLMTTLLVCGTTWAQDMKPFLTLKGSRLALVCSG
jgi:hypothetical protein